MFYDSNQWVFRSLSRSNMIFLVFKGVTPTFSNLGILLKRCLLHFGIWRSAGPEIRLVKLELDHVTPKPKETSVTTCRRSIMTLPISISRKNPLTVFQTFFCFCILMNSYHCFKAKLKRALNFLGSIRQKNSVAYWLCNEYWKKTFR